MSDSRSVARQSGNLSVFRSRAARERYLAAYEATLALWPVPFHSIHVSSRYGPTHAIVSGSDDAPPLILLHAASASATMWYPNVGELARNFRVYALDTAGDAGKSQLENSIARTADLAGWLVDVFEELGIEKADVLGASFGGWLALALALRFPERVGRLVLLSPANSFGRFSLSFGLRIVPSAIFKTRSLIDRSILPLFAVPPHPIFHQQLALAATCRVRTGWPQGYKDSELARIGNAALLLTGDREVVLANPRASVRRARRQLPGLLAETVPGAGHLLSMDRPEWVGSRIVRFLSR